MRQMCTTRLCVTQHELQLVRTISALSIFPSFFLTNASTGAYSQREAVRIRRNASGEALRSAARTHNLEQDAPHANTTAVPPAAASVRICKLLLPPTACFSTPATHTSQDPLLGAPRRTRRVVGEPHTSTGAAAPGHRREPRAPSSAVLMQISRAASSQPCLRKPAPRQPPQGFREMKARTQYRAVAGDSYHYKIGHDVKSDAPQKELQLRRVVLIGY